VRRRGVSESKERRTKKERGKERRAFRKTLKPNKNKKEKIEENLRNGR
jgi:hypothetical protein